MKNYLKENTLHLKQGESLKSSTQCHIPDYHNFERGPHAKYTALND